MSLIQVTMYLPFVALLHSDRLAHVFLPSFVARHLGGVDERLAALAVAVSIAAVSPAITNRVRAGLFKKAVFSLTALVIRKAGDDPNFSRSWPRTLRLYLSRLISEFESAIKILIAVSVAPAILGKSSTIVIGLMVVVSAYFAYVRWRLAVKFLRDDTINNWRTSKQASLKSGYEHIASSVAWYSLKSSMPSLQILVLAAFAVVTLFVGITGQVIQSLEGFLAAAAVIGVALAAQSEVLVGIPVHVALGKKIRNELNEM